MSLITGNKVTFSSDFTKTMHNGFPPPIFLLNISVYRLQPRLFMDSLPYLKKTKGP
jgi:hypothetical protein